MLSAEAQANLGLTSEMLRPIHSTPFVRAVAVPAIVVERPGRTQLPVSAPLTGVVTHVHAVTGEAVTPGTLLFQIRLTDENLVGDQTEFLRTVGNLAVEEKEVERLRSASESGALPGKVLLERQYARDKLLASLATQREALRLHGLSANQIDHIQQDRRLLRELRIVVPGTDKHEHEEDDGWQLSQQPNIRQAAFHRIATQSSGNDGTPPPTLVLQKLRVQKGDAVSTGDGLCVLADYSELYIEGHAFETDAAAIVEAKSRGWKAVALVDHGGTQIETGELDIAYLANEIDTQARTLPFFVSLTNEITDDSRNDRGQRFVAWRYRPGQRLQLRVPVEQWPDQLVLPVDAVVKDGPDSFVFRKNGFRFSRVAVHERFRDRTSVVIANDGAIAIGDVVAFRGAHQMQLALKNKSAGGVDPHAGHHH